MQATTSSCVRRQTARRPVNMQFYDGRPDRVSSTVIGPCDDWWARSVSSHSLQAELQPTLIRAAEFIKLRCNSSIPVPDYRVQTSEFCQKSFDGWVARSVFSVFLLRKWFVTRYESLRSSSCTSLNHQQHQCLDKCSLRSFRVRTFSHVIYTSLWKRAVAACGGWDERVILLYGGAIIRLANIGWFLSLNWPNLPPFSCNNNTTCSLIPGNA